MEITIGELQILVVSLYTCKMSSAILREKNLTHLADVVDKDINKAMDTLDNVVRRNARSFDG
jgi:hypothetical protein